MNTREAAAYLKISPFYLRNMRQGQHPYDGPECTPVVSTGGVLRSFKYTKEALDAWSALHPWRKRGGRGRRSP